MLKIGWRNGLVGLLLFFLVLALILYNPSLNPPKKIECIGGHMQMPSDIRVENYHKAISSAIEKKDPSECDKNWGPCYPIVAYGVPDADKCYTDLAVALKDTAICDKKPSTLCYYSMASDRNDWSICKRMVSKLGGSPDYCYSNVAKKINDINICNKISIVEERESCFSNVGGATGEIASCEAINHDGKRDGCYFYASATNKDLNICWKLTNTNWHYSIQKCYSNIGKKYLDINICKLVSDSDERGPCIEHIAIVKKDTAFCKMIDNLFWKDHCFSAVAHGAKDPSICQQITISKQSMEDCIKSASS